MESGPNLRPSQYRHSALDLEHAFEFARDKNHQQRDELIAHHTPGLRIHKRRHRRAGRISRFAGSPETSGEGASGTSGRRRRTLGAALAHP